MKYDHYDSWEFNKIKEQIKINPSNAKEEFEEYLKDHPNDYSARSYYVYCLITLGDFNQAQYQLEKLKKDYSTDPHFAKYTDKIKLLNFNNLLDQIRIFCRKGKFQQVYYLYTQNKNLLRFDDSSFIFYCQQKMGMYKIEDRAKYSYVCRQ